VDVLYFVSIPPLFDRNYRWGGWIFRANPQEFKYNPYTTKSGLRMIAVPIDQESMVPICRMNDSEINELMKYAESAYAR
jgi:hypothetical protein